MLSNPENLEIDPDHLQVNDLVVWVDCPISWFGPTRVIEISDDRKLARLAFIWHWVAISKLRWHVSIEGNARKFWRRYQTIE